MPYWESTYWIRIQNWPFTSGTNPGILSEKLILQFVISAVILITVAARIMLHTSEVQGKWILTWIRLILTIAWFILMRIRVCIQTLVYLHYLQIQFQTGSYTGPNCCWSRYLMNLSCLLIIFLLHPTCSFPCTVRIQPGVFLLWMIWYFQAGPSSIRILLVASLIRRRTLLHKKIFMYTTLIFQDISRGF